MHVFKCKNVYIRVWQSLLLALCCVQHLASFCVISWIVKSACLAKRIASILLAFHSRPGSCLVYAVFHFLLMKSPGSMKREFVLSQTKFCVMLCCRVFVAWHTKWWVWATCLGFWEDLLSGYNVAASTILDVAHFIDGPPFVSPSVFIFVSISLSVAVLFGFQLEDVSCV